MDKQNNLIVPSAILGIAFLIGLIVLASAWRSNSSINETITVTGSAKKDIVSDFGIIKGVCNIRSATSIAGYQELQKQIPLIKQYLKSKGIKDENIEFESVMSYPIYQFTPQGQQTTNILEYQYSQRINIKDSDVYRIKDLSIAVSSLIEQGIEFKVEMTEYYYSKLSDVKIDVQAAAAKDALLRAEKISAATGRDIGAMRNARMGVLQITPKFSNQISDYGINDLSSIEKEITAVVTASFEIK